ncbi:hypothetical protein NZK35_32560 [Stieleria sp. ICT_E10.1]|uniref:hypothetical protein n=1 Tax=Stieleria sedimenti TaxID=2976331 RepID=UPI00217FC4D4|nr:hypothetical protein [Stieleria sedimenti]MCS7471404.1 hypothetical protein [Stieleria sedimenti]
MVKTPDIGRAQPDRRSLGIYELKDGVRRVCLVEQGGTDVPAEERIPDMKYLKRPKTFESPAGSNTLLMEFTEVGASLRFQPDGLPCLARIIDQRPLPIF